MAIPDNYIDKITKGNDSRMISPAADMVRVNNDNFDGETLDEVLDDVAQAISDVGADVFVVNIESDGNDGYTCDKTNAEIYAAWQAGRNIVLIRDSEFLYNLNIPPSQTDCEFSGDDYEDIAGHHQYTIYTRNGQQKVLEVFIYFQEHLQSGTNIRTINNQSLLGSGNLTASDIGALPSNTHIPADQVQSNWNETNTSSKAYIQNKPTIPAAQVNSDWDASSGVAQILNKPTFKTINGESIVGTGDIEAGSGDVATAFTITITSTTIEVQPMTGAMMTVGTDVSFQVV